MTPSRMPLLEMQGITRVFPGVLALDSVDLNIYPGEVHALIGENGAGKSTLIKILSGAQLADKGKIILRGREIVFHNPWQALDEGISTINQELMLIPKLSVAENILLGQIPHKKSGRVDWGKARNRTVEILEMLGLRLDPDDLVENLSVAEQQAVEIAKALSRQAEIIIMDEPTSSLTSKEIDNLLEIILRLKRQGKTVILITHKLDETFRVSDTISVLRDGHHIATLETKKTSPDEIVNLMVGRSVDSIFTKREGRIGEPVLEVRNLSSAGKFSDISFTLHKGEVLGFAGLIGAGRTEVARAIFGADPIDSGEISIEGLRIDTKSLNKRIDAGIGLVPEDRKQQGLILGMALGDNLVLSVLSRLTRFGLRSSGKERKIAGDLSSSLSIKAPSLNTEVLTLSGGNQQKVIIGKWLATHPKVLILDEPTRGIDIGAKAEVHALVQQLASTGVGLILISSELVEVTSVSDRILVMCEGKITGEFAYRQATEEQIMACATGQVNMIAEKATCR